MSKLGIVVCAVAFFVSTELTVSGQQIYDITYSPQLDILNRKVAIRHIDEAIEKINGRSAKLREKVRNSGPQKDSEKLGVITPILNEISWYLGTLKFSINHYVKTSNPSRAEIEKCQRYFAEYVIAVNSHVMALKKRAFKNAYHNATMIVGHVLNETDAKKTELTNLKENANACVGFECNRISNAARHIYSAFSEDIDDATAYYESMTNGQAALKTIRFYWDYYVDMGQELLKTTYNCVHHHKK